MAKKEKSVSLVSAISVETPKVTDLNISRADLISYVTAETQKQYEVILNNLTLELGQAMTVYFDRQIAIANKVIEEFNQKALSKGIPTYNHPITHRAMAGRIMHGMPKIEFNDNDMIIRLYGINNHYMISSRHSANPIMDPMDISEKVETTAVLVGNNILTDRNTLSAKIRFENPTEEEVANFNRLNNLINNINQAITKVTDKSTKNSIISNMLEGSDKGKQMKASLQAIANSIRSELNESLKLTK